MLSIITKMLNNPLTGKVSNRLANRYTTQGGLILLFVAVEAGILPKEVITLLDGVPNLHYWVLGGVAFWLILTKSSNVIDYFITTKQEELDNIVIETKILEEKVKQKELNKTLKN